jgi:hypothetical protein
MPLQNLLLLSTYHKLSGILKNNKRNWKTKTCLVFFWTLQLRCMLICLRYLSYCLCISIYLRFSLLSSAFSTAVDRVGLVSTTHTIYLLFVLYFILSVSLGVSLQSMLFSISVKVIEAPAFKAPRILELQGLSFANP